MPKVKITTAQNVDIYFKPAGIGDRFVALLIDTLIRGVFAFVSLSIVYSLNVPQGLQTALVILSLLPVFLYHLVFELLMDGQSPGKSVVNIKIIKTDASSPSFGSYFMRWIFRIVEVNLLLGAPAIIAMIINDKGQRLGDMAAGTMVIKLELDKDLSGTVFTLIDEKYMPVFPQAAFLDSETIVMIKDVLNLSIRKDKMNTKQNTLIKKAKMMVQKKLNVKSEMSSKTFLSTVVKDYNYFNYQKD